MGIETLRVFMGKEKKILRQKPPNVFDLSATGMHLRARTHTCRVSPSCPHVSNATPHPRVPKPLRTRTRKLTHCPYFPTRQRGQECIEQDLE